MQRSHLSDMTVFVEVARNQGFRAAAEKLKLGPGTVSEAIQRFEDRLGVRLIDRSTRSMALTGAGEKLYRRSLPALTDLESALNELEDVKDEVSGVLRLTAPRSAGPFFLDALIARFAAAYPEVTIDLSYDDQKVDLVASGVDAAIRSKTLLEQNTHAVPVGPELAMALVASADYLATHGHPKKPADLLAHDGICFSFGSIDNLAPWGFVGDQGMYSVQPKPRLVVNELTSLLAYAEEGLGIAYTYAKPAEDMIKAKRLKSLLKKHMPTLPTYSLNYVSKRHMPARLRAFIDMAKEAR